jgi:class 3 adenylate cyclase
LEIVGDDAVIVFVSPRKAIYAALELQEHFQRVIEAGRHLPVGLKVGVETAEAIPYRGKYAGFALYLVARVCQAAETGEVLIGETLAHLIRRAEDLQLTDRGQVEIEGYTTPVRVMRVVRSGGEGQEHTAVSERASGRPQRV